MDRAAENAPLFIEAFWNTCVELEGDGIGVPDASNINQALTEHAAGYELRPPHLIALTAYTPVAVRQQTHP